MEIVVFAFNLELIQFCFRFPNFMILLIPVCFCVITRWTKNKFGCNVSCVFPCLNARRAFPYMKMGAFCEYRIRAKNKSRQFKDSICEREFDLKWNKKSNKNLPLLWSCIHPDHLIHWSCLKIQFDVSRASSLDDPWSYRCAYRWNTTIFISKQFHQQEV